MRKKKQVKCYYSQMEQDKIIKISFENVFLIKYKNQKCNFGWLLIIFC